MSLDQRLAMFASGNVVDIDRLEKGEYYLILHIYLTNYGLRILKLNRQWGTSIHVWLPSNYNHHFPSEVIAHINCGNLFLRMRYKGSYLRYVFLEFCAIE